MVSRWSSRLYLVRCSFRFVADEPDGVVALMKDQVAALKDKGIEAAMLYEKSLDKDVAYVSNGVDGLGYTAKPLQIKKQLRMGHPDLRILYLTPETLFSHRCSSELEVAYKQRQLRRLVVDEVSQ